MDTETGLMNLRIWGGPIVAVIQPIDGVHNGSAAKVTVSYDEKNDRYCLECDDLVANTWVEYFPSLSTALMRMASLARCGEEDWNRSFYYESDSEHFLYRAEEFLQEQTA